MRRARKAGTVLLYTREEIDDKDLVLLLLDDREDGGIGTGSSTSRCLVLEGDVFVYGVGDVVWLSGILDAAKEIG